METKQQLSREETVRILRDWYTVGDRIEQHLSAVKPGTIVGFGKKYIQRGGFDHKRAGVYMDLFTLRIQGDDGSEWEQGVGGPMLNVRKSDVWNDAARLQIRLCNLPDTSFWIGDTVETTAHCGVGVSDRRKNDKLLVEDINYAHPDGIVRYTITGRGLYKVSMTSIYLVVASRGNIWKLEHGEPLSFSGATEAERLMEEAAFYKSLGMSEKIPFSETGKYWDLWPIANAISTLEIGLADQIKIKKGSQQAVLIKYDNAEFGARMRAAELKRLGF